MLVVLVALVVLSYGFFEARKLVEGPRITINLPADGSATSSTLVTIVGTAENVSFLTINDKPAFTDPQGNFTQVLSPPAGYTVFTVAALDRFGRRASKQVRITVLNYCPVNA